MKTKDFFQRTRGIVARFIRKTPLRGFLGKAFAKFAGRFYRKYNLRADDINNIFLSYIERTIDDFNKFFVWLHYMDTHYPWLPPEEYIPKPLTKSDVIDINFSGNPRKPVVKKLYDASIRYVDNAIHRLIETLDSRGLLNDTYIIITSDHGEDFGEHGLWFHNAPSLYEERVRVPLIIIGPGIKQERIDKPVSLIDLAPTILHLLVKKNKFQCGLSLLSRLESNNFPPVFGEAGITTNITKSYPKFRLTSISVKVNEWKYIHRLDGEDKLFNLKNDPLEKENLIYERKDIASELLTKIEDHLQDVRKFNRQYTRHLISKKVRYLKRRLSQRISA